MSHEISEGGFTVSTDPARLDVDAVHAFLTTSYWAEGIPRDVVERSLRNSLCFGLYEGERQVGLARVITDLTTYAYLCDVYVLPKKRGQGLGKLLMRGVMDHPDLAGYGASCWSPATPTSSTDPSGSAASPTPSATWRSPGRGSIRRCRGGFAMLDLASFMDYLNSNLAARSCG